MALCAMWVARRGSTRLHGTLKQRPKVTDALTLKQRPKMAGALTMPPASARRMPNRAPCLVTAQAKEAKDVALAARRW